jgi:hypothetical protein
LFSESGMVYDEFSNKSQPVNARACGSDRAKQLGSRIIPSA